MKTLTLILALCLAGCAGTSPDLRIYRDSQWATLSPALDAHALLIQQARAVDAAYVARQAAPSDPATQTALNNAVQAVRRSQADQDSVTEMITEIKRIHDTSVSHDSAATQPATIAIP